MRIYGSSKCFALDGRGVCLETHQEIDVGKMKSDNEDLRVK